MHQRNASINSLSATVVSASRRSWRIPLLLLLTMLLAVPLWQLSNDESAASYKQYIYDNVSRYFVHDQAIYNNTLYQDGDVPVHAQFNFSTPCEGFPDTRGVLLVMKTGATESFAKIPTHLLTSMQCLPDFLIFSDLEQQIGKYHLENVLDRVNDTIRKSHREFALYSAQASCPVSQDACTEGVAGAWDLDKYKFLNMVERTWEKRPDMDWYVFAEADTYIIWSNLVVWLREHAPEGEAYIGSVAMINNQPFAHGGSGYVVSGAMMKKMVESIPGIAARYDERATHECCGDLLFSMAVQEAGGKVKQAHPMFNGEKPSTLPYGPGHWCEPLLTMHHMNPEEVSMVWQYEQTRTNKTEVIQIKDVYQAFMAPHLVNFRSSWDNLSDDVCYISHEDTAQVIAGEHEKSRQKEDKDKNAVERLAHESPASCARVCEAAGLDIRDDEYERIESNVDKSTHIREKFEAARKDHGFRKDRSCFQWRYNRGACCVSRSFKLGRPRREDKEEDKWTSGWFVKGIEDWIEARAQCEKVNWKEVS